VANPTRALLAVLLATASGCASAYAAPLVGTTPGLVTKSDLIARSASVPTPNVPSSGASQYVVQPGDTLWRISQRFAMSVTDLRAKNGLDGNNSIRVGQTLTVGHGAAIASERAADPAREPLRGATPEHAEGRGLAPSGSALPLRNSTAPPPQAGQGARKYALTWPVEGVLTSRFGSRNGKGHDGIDIGAAPGTAVKAAAAGDVIFADTHGSYGNLVLVRHAGGLVTVYAHNAKNLVNKGQRVKQGQAIATVGSTGHATGPHLHFEVRRGVAAENPLSLLPP
jgi:lipoprotein NlpD